ncbi:hypothetical protein LDENG_00246110 [Lucifuga dentata]|nr:hypothetical protein LDENG_00246110 [Lucifuga dentata]
MEDLLHRLQVEERRLRAKQMQAIVQCREERSWGSPADVDEVLRWPDKDGARRARRSGLMVGESGATPARSPPMAGISTPTPSTPLAPQDSTPRGSLMPGPLSSIPRGGIKLPHYNRDGPLDTYLIQVHMAAQLNGWTDGETAVHLALALEGKALQNLSDLNPEEQLNCAALMASLEQRFGQPTYHDDARTQLSSRARREGESLGVFAADLRFLTRCGYPSFPPTVQEELALQAFIQGLHPECLWEHVHLLAPTTLFAALQAAERAEPILRTTTQPPNTSARVRRAEWVEDNISDEEAVQQAAPDSPHQSWRRTMRQRDGRHSDSGCYRCGESGHVACYCPAPQPLQPQPALNSRGMAQ